MYILFLLISYCGAFGYTDPMYVIQKFQLLTPRLYDDHFKPEKFSNTSNLLIKTGSPFQAKGTELHIVGQVFDLLGRELENVIIKFYHANTFGFYNYATDPKNFAEYDTDLVDTGRVITENLGRYKIITVLPGVYGERAPHVHMIIKYKNFLELETQMFFENHPLNKKDKVFAKFSKSFQDLLICRPVKSQNDSDVLTCEFNIRLNVIHRSHFT